MGVDIAEVLFLDCVACWEIGGDGVAGDVGSTYCVHRYATAVLREGSAEEGGVDKDLAVRVHLGYEGVAIPVELRLEWVKGGEVA